MQRVLLVSLGGFNEVGGIMYMTIYFVDGSDNLERLDDIDSRQLSKLDVITPYGINSYLFNINSEKR